MKKETIQVNVKMLDEERDVVQIKVPAKKIEAIRKENSNYRLIPA